MKPGVWIISLLLLSGAGRHASTLEGHYCTTRTSDFAGSNYWFKSDSTFESNGWTCMSSDTGAGHYRITSDSLIFYYDSLDTEKAVHTEIDTLAAGGDSCSLHFYLYDGTGPVMFAQAVVNGSSGKNFGGMSGVDGNGVVKIPRNEFPVTVTFRLIGYMPVRTKIETGQNLKLSIRMSGTWTYVIPGGTVHAYGLKEFTKEQIVLTSEYVDENGQVQEFEWSLYRK